MYLQKDMVTKKNDMIVLSGSTQNFGLQKTCRSKSKEFDKRISKISHKISATENKDGDLMVT